jgi:hypothetical protein
MGISPRRYTEIGLLRPRDDSNGYADPPGHPAPAPPLTGPDEHVIGAVVIFMDIINLFLLILQLVGLGRGR